MITYRGKTYSFSVKDGILEITDEKLKSMPKAVLLLLLAGAARGTVLLPDAFFEGLTAKMGKYLENGQLNEVGRRVFRNDRELLAAIREPEIALNDRGNSVPCSEVVKSGDQEIILQPVDTTQVKPPLQLAVEKNGKGGLGSLLDMILQFLVRFVAFPDPAQAVAVSLWVAHTWVIDAFRITPYLFIHSPTKRSGKSRLMECLFALVCRPWSVVFATEAVIMRKLDTEKSTLLFDEIDTVYRSSRDKSKEGLRAVLNCGFERGKKVPRCAGRAVIEYDVFGPKAFAGIGDRLPDTVKDRSIRIHLLRRPSTQFVETFRLRQVEESANPIIERLVAWASDEQVIRTLAESRPTIPIGLGDRAADIAEPLFAIADLAGGDWPRSTRTALSKLLALNEEDSQDAGTNLLSAIRDIFIQEEKRQLPTILLLRKLAARDEEAEWTTQWPRACAVGNTRGPAAKMAGLLRPFGISAGTIRLPDGTTPKGYRLEAFSDAFARYLPALPEKDATTPQENVEQLAGESSNTEKPSDDDV